MSHSMKYRRWIAIALAAALQFASLADMLPAGALKAAAAQSSQQSVTEAAYGNTSSIVTPQAVSVPTLAPTATPQAASVPTPVPAAAQQAVSTSTPSPTATPQPTATPTPTPLLATPTATPPLIETTYGKDFSDAALIQADIPVNGYVSSSSDVNFFKFVPPSNGAYIIQSSGNINVYAYLYDSAHNQITYDYDSGSGSNFYIPYWLNAGYTYYIKVINQSSTLGTYSIKAASAPDEYGNTKDNPCLISVGTEVTGEINYTKDIDVFKFTPQVSASYSFESTGSTDTYGELYDYNYGRIAYNEDISTDNKNFKINMSLTANQAYYIAVMHHNHSDADTAGTGKYGLKVSTAGDDYGNDFNSAYTIQEGTETQGCIESTGDADFFKFSPLKSGMYALESSGELSSSYYTQGTLYDSNKNSLTSNYYYGVGNNFYIPYQLEANQVYYLKVNSLNNYYTGKYSVKFYSLTDDYGNDNSHATQTNLGDEASGQINYTGDVDVFKFTPTQSAIYAIKSTGTTDTYCELRNSGNGTISSNDDANSSDKNFYINTSLTANQDYYIWVYHHSRYDLDTLGTGAYKFTISQSNSFDSAVEIKEETTVSGNIENKGDAGYYKFTPSKSGMYALESSGELSSNYYIQGTLYDSNKNSLTDNYYFGVGNNFYIPYLFEANKTYYLKVNSLYDYYTGKYSVKFYSLSDDYGNDINHATVVSLGSETAAEINYTRDVDVFKFTPTQSAIYVIRSKGTTDTYCELRNSGNGTINSNDDANSSDKNFYINTSLTANQDYYIWVYHHNRTDMDTPGVGKYSFTVSMGSSFDSAVEIKEETTVSGNIENKGDAGYYKFTPSKSGMYALESSGELSTNYYIQGTLYDSNKNSLIDNYYFGVGNNFYIPYLFEASRTYYLKVNSLYDNYTGKYSVKFYSLSDDYGNDINHAAVVSLDSETAGEIGYTRDVDVFKFTPTQSAIYVIRSKGTTDTYCELRNSGNGTISSNDDANTSDKNFYITTSLTANQDYYIWVYHHNRTDLDTPGVGKYSFTVSMGSSFDSAVEIKEETTVSGNIENKGDAGYFKFTPSKTGMYALESSGELSSNYYIQGTLYDSNKKSLTDNYNSGIGYNFYIPYLLEASKTYYLKVNSLYDSYTGKYSVKFYSLPDDYGNDVSHATEVKLGNETQGEINYTCDVDVFKFTTTQSGIYVIKSTGTTDTYCELRSSSGGQYCSNDNASTTDSNFYIAYKLDANQTYYIYVYHHNHNDLDTPGTGKYTLSLSTTTDDCGNTFTTANEIKERIATDSGIDYFGDDDYYKFTPSSSGNYTFESTGNSVNLYGYLYNDSQSYITYDYNSAGNGNFRIVSNLTAGKTYYLRVYSSSSYQAGTYSIRIYPGSDDYANDITSAMQIQTDVSVQGNIDYTKDVDFLRFTPTKDGIYTVRSTGTLDMYGELYNNAGQITGFSDNTSDTDLNFSMTQCLYAGQSYFIKVRASKDSDTGSYNIIVTSSGEKPEDDFGNSFDTAAALQPDTQTAGKINYAGDVDFLSFTPETSGMYTIESTGSTNTVGYLYDASHNLITYDDNKGTGDNFYIPYYLSAGNTYFIKAAHYLSSGTGAYSIKASLVKDDFGNDLASSSEIKTGTETSGEISYPCDVDVFKFQVPSNAPYLIATIGSTDTLGELYNGNGGMLYSNDNASDTDKNFKIAISLQVGQVYYVKVKHHDNTDKDTAGLGSYVFKVSAIKDDHGNDLNTATAIEEGSETSGSIESMGDADFFKLTASTSGNYIIKTTGTTNTFGYLYDSTGSLISSNDNNGTDTNLYIKEGITAQKTYYIKVCHSSSTGLGDYVLSVSKEAQVPSAPSSLTATEITYTSLKLSWIDSNDTGIVKGIKIFDGSNLIAAAVNSPYTLSGLTPGKTYDLTVKAYNQAGVLSAASNNVSATTIKDNEAPTTPSGLTVITKTGTSVLLGWNDSSDNSGVKTYEIYRNGNLVTTTSAITYKDAGLTSGNTYTYKVRAYDAANNFSGFSSDVLAVLLAPHITKINPANGVTIGGQSQSLSVYVTDSGNKNGASASFSYSKDGINWSVIAANVPLYSYDSNTLYSSAGWNLGNVATGNWSVSCKVYDADNNCDSITAIYTVDKDAPGAVQNLTAQPTAGGIALGWSQSEAADTARYNIYKLQSSGQYALLTYTTGRSSVSYTDNAVTVGQTYSYYVTAVDKFGQEGPASGIKSAKAAIDNIAPVVLGIEPSNDTILGAHPKITVRGQDNILLKSIKLQYQDSTGSEWKDISTIDTTGTASFDWNAEKLSGSVTVRAIAVDASGNTSDGTPTRNYTIDTQGPSKVTGLTSSAYASNIVLNWNDVPDQDFSYFMVEKKTSQTGAYENIGNVYDKRGINIDGLTPNTSYWFRVTAYDIYGNRGTSSDDFNVNTKADSTAPVITSLDPKPARFKDVIPFSTSVQDNVAVASITIQTSSDAKNWKDAVTSAISGTQRDVVYKYNIDVSSTTEGSIFVRPVAKDTSGNISDTSGSAPYVQYIIDHTAPSTPSGIKATPSAGDILLQWNQGTESDILCYKVYRSQTTGTGYTLLSDKVSALWFRDTNVVSGNDYFYKVSAVDQAGNESILSTELKARLLTDTEAPKIARVTPTAGITLPANPQISILATDNYLLSKVSLYYMAAGDNSGNWTLIGTQSFGSACEVSVFTWNTKGLKDGDYSLKAVVQDSAGLVSEPSITNYKLNLEAPAAPVLTAVPGGWKVDLSWTSGKETDLAGFRIYRSTSSNSSYKLIKETTDTSYTDSVLTPGQSYYYKVEAVDAYKNTSTSNEVSAVPLSTDTYAPAAEAGEDIKAISGLETAFDGTKSTDNDKIASYLWDFGDGASSSEAQPRHVYGTTGTYTVKLTVKDPSGNSASDTLKVTVCTPKEAGTIKVHVLDDSTGTAIPGADVYVDFTDDTPKHYTADGEGYVTIVAAEGNYSVSAFREKYLPSDASAVVKQYQTTDVIVRLKKGEIVIGNLTVRRMNLSEIEAAGIDTKAPENQYVYKYEIHLEFNQVPFPVQNVYVNGYGGIVGDYAPISFGGGSGGSIAYPNPIPSGHPEVAPTMAYLIIPAKVSWLKEFFEVSLLVKNMADPKFELVNSSVELKLPDGLSLAPTAKAQTLKVDLGTIAGGDTSETKWIIRGDKKGEYNLQADFKSKLMPFDEPVNTVFKTKEPFKVWAGDALHIYIQPEDSAYIGEDYYVKFKISNVSDIPVYNINAAFGSYDVPVREIDTIDSKGGITVQKATGDGGIQYVMATSDGLKYLPNLRSGDLVEVTTLMPGESIYGTYVLTFNAPGDRNIVYYKLANAFSIKMADSNVDVPVTITSIPSHLSGYVGLTTSQLLSNTGFDTDTSGWLCNTDSPAKVSISKDTSTYDTAPSSLRIDCTNKGNNAQSVQLLSTVPFKVQKDSKYVLTFRAKCSGNGFNIPAVMLAKRSSPWSVYTEVKGALSVTGEWQSYMVRFTANATADDARIVFFLGNSIPEGSSLFIDTLSLKETTDNQTAPGELLSNPSFNTDSAGWLVNTDSSAVAGSGIDNATFDTAPASFKIQSVKKGSSSTSIQLLTTAPIAVESGKQYTLTFKAKATSSFRIPSLSLSKKSSPWSNYADSVYGIDITNSWQTYTVKFTANATANDARLVFFLGNAIPEGTILNIDTLSFRALPEALTSELISNPSFDIDSAGWLCNVDSLAQVIAGRDTQVSDSLPASYMIKSLKNVSSVGSIQFITTTPFKLESGKEYTLTFKAKCTKNLTIPYILLQKMTSPWGNYATPCTGLLVTDKWQTYTVKFTANATASDARLALFLGNSIPEGAVFNIDTVSLKKTN